MMRDLRSRSARQPAGAEKSRKGSTKAAPTVAVITPACSTPWTPIRQKMIRSFRMLSFMAPRNWVALNHRKERREELSGDSIVGS